MKIYENQFVKFRVGKRDYRRRCVGNLFAVGLDDAGRNDEHNRKYGSYGYEQVRLDAFPARLLLGTRCLDFIRGNFRVAFSNGLQPFDQGLKPS